MEIYSGLTRQLGPIAITIGSFDGVHLGHRAILARLGELAAEQGARSVVLTFDPHPRQFFDPGSAPKLLTTPAEREPLLAEAGVAILLRIPFDAALAATAAEDFVVRSLFSLGDVRGIVAGYDFRFGRDRAGDTALLAALGARHRFVVARVAPQECDGVVVKSTRIREAIGAADLPLAMRLLGRHHFVTGRVVHGDGRGRQIGFSTANLERTDPRKLLPPAGVYAVRVALLEQDAPVLDGVANLGTRPTFGAGETVLEVHVLDGEHDLYGRAIRVSFVARIREERRFDSAASLREQIGRDVVDARRLL